MRRFRQALWIAASLLLASCGHRGDSVGPAPELSSSTTLKPPRAPFPGKPTSALIQRPEVAALVDALAKESTFESSHIGAAGAPSAVYAKFEAIWKAANDDEKRALLQHTSEVVRAYAAQRIAQSEPALQGALVALAEDRSAVRTQQGCMGGLEDVGSMLVDALCWSRLPEAKGTLVAIAQAGGYRSSRALLCGAPSAPAAASEAAAKALRGDAHPEGEVDYLSVFSVVWAASPEEGCSLARARVTSKDASVQIAAAKALWRCEDDTSRALLEQLAGDRNVVVARHAKASLFLLVPARREMLGSDVEVAREAVDRLSKVMESPEGARGAIGLVEALSLAHPMRMGGVFARAAETPEVTQAALRLVAKLEPGASRVWGAVRADVIDYLARAKDPAALPELRRSLGAGDPMEIRAAIRGVVALKDKASRPAVTKLKEHPDKEVARVAEEALAAF